VNGIPFRSDVVSFGDGGDGAYGYPVGAGVAVRYDPENPDIATLETGASWRNYFGIVVLVGICAAGAWGYSGDRSDASSHEEMRRRRMKDEHKRTMKDEG